MSNIESLVFYYVSFLLSAFFLKYGCLKKRRSNILIFISVLIPTLISGFRYNVGTDYSTYNAIFTTIRRYSFIELYHNGLPGFNGENTFVLISKVFLSVFSNKTYFGIITLFTVGIFVITIVEQYNKLDLFLVYFLYLVLYYSESLNNVRQYLSLSILFYSIKYIFNKKVWKFLACLLVSCLFHMSSVFMLPMYFVWNNDIIKRIPKRFYFLVVILALVIVANWREIFQYLIRSGLLSYGRAAIYLTSSGSDNRDFYVKAILLIVMVIFWKKMIKANRKMRLFNYMYVIAIMFSSVGFLVGHLKRIALYYQISDVLFLPFIERFLANKRSRHTYRLVVVILACAYFAINYYVLGHTKLIPYTIV